RRVGRAVLGATRERTFAEPVACWCRRSTGESAPERMIVIRLACRRLRWRSLATLWKLGAESFGNATEQRCKFEPAHEARQRLRVRLADQRLGERHVQWHVRIEDHQHPRQPRLVGASEQALAPRGGRK